MIAAIAGSIAFFEIEEAPTPPVTPRAKKAPRRPMINLRRLAGATVPAHGLSVTSRGIVAGGLGGKFFFWIRKLLGAVSVAGMIALGLFVYTEFTEAWEKRGLPTIPISALAALDKASQGHQNRPAGPADRGGMYQSQGRRDENRQQPLSLLDDYIG
jgi:hypothetical protein